MSSSFFQIFTGNSKRPDVCSNEGSTLMHRYERPLLDGVTCHVEIIDDFWDFTAIWHDRKVGYAYGVVQGDALELADLHVKDDLIIPWMPLFPQNYAFKSDFRRKGIGSELLRLVIKTASEHQIKRIYGWGTQSDLEQFPGILEWFQEFGFTTSRATGHFPSYAAWRFDLEPALLIRLFQVKPKPLGEGVKFGQGD